MPDLITTIDKNKTEQIRITLTEYRGTNLVDIRIHWLKDENEIIPTRKGISLNVDRLDELLAGLTEAKERISHD